MSAMRGLRCAIGNLKTSPSPQHQLVAEEAEHLIHSGVRASQFVLAMLEISDAAIRLAQLELFKGEERT